MHYIVSEKFYDMVSALIGIAVDEQNEVELELAMNLISELVIDTPETREYYGKE